jgi:SpoIID/LytB domain protein
MTEPLINVGIVAGETILFLLNGDYTALGKAVPAGRLQRLTLHDNRILWGGELFDELLFAPTRPAADSFVLEDVVIGIGFHWERRERQCFRGALRVVVEDCRLRAINIVGVEEYLTSVISSEMSATSSMGLLKAHAVISRSWLLSQIAQRDTKRAASQSSAQTDSQSFIRTDNELIRWYDREDHTLFDVCADDHCQRYQGITRRTTDTALQAVSETAGEVLTFGGEICDARFSKCCGGAFEEFPYCWEPQPHPYLTRGLDNDAACATLPDLTVEAEAERWIRSAPQSFCNTTDHNVLSQVLNGYDRETADFYRWRVDYTQEELSALIRRRSGVDYGEIVDLKPVARGVSGRLWKLQIVGTRRTMTIGKELEIRRALSPSHLYSSAFVVERKELSPNGIPARFTIVGAGWGHGVGLCQIGAAMMSERGYAYDAILRHYYRGATLEKLY